MKTWIVMAAMLAAAAEIPADLKKARDAQDRAALDGIAAAAEAEAQARQGDAKAHYRAATAQSVRAEVLMEQRDRGASRAAAEAGIRAAERAVAIDPANGEYHRILGTLCGQVIPANVLAGMRYGKCALDEINKSVELLPKSAAAWLSRGVGNYYLPPSFGGGPDVALKDVEKALQLDANSADGWLWKGIVLRKMNRNAEARKALEKSLELNPQRVWTKQQLEKTPEK